MSYHHTANLQMLHFIYLFNKYTYRIFYTCCTLSLFFSSKCRLFHNATFFGSCVIHILYTGCVKIKKKKFRRQRVNPSCCHGTQSSTTPITYLRHGIGFSFNTRLCFIHNSSITIQNENKLQYCSYFN